MAVEVSIERQLVCAFCGRPIAPLLDGWQPTVFGAVHDGPATGGDDSRDCLAQLAKGMLCRPEELIVRRPANLTPCTRRNAS